jgi:mxaJ protein
MSRRPSAAWRGRSCTPRGVASTAPGSAARGTEDAHPRSVNRPTLLAAAALVAAASSAAQSPRDAAGVATPAAVRPWAAGTPAARVLRVCADPNNLPFSDSTGAGFELRLAELVGRELGARVERVWWAQRRGHVRNTLAAGACDVLLGVPSSFERALATRPYYRSTYVFVTRRGAPAIRSFDDPALRRLRIGVSVVGDDYSATPPVHALLARGVPPGNLRGYTVYGDYRRPSPPSRVIEAVARGEVDVAVAWGPLAGWFASRQRVPLRVEPVSPQIDLPFMPFVFDIAMGVRRTDTALRDSLDAIIVRRRRSIDSLLAAYHVPRADRAVVGAR